MGTCLFLLFLPARTSAAVIVSEVAWMGNAVSANDEWIELQNTDSSTVSLDGWTLTDGVSLDIPLVGSIAPSSYVVLERTDETSAPGTAFLIYTGALSNTGSTLTLKRSDGGIEDQVAGGENWESIGGDNTTKETPQYTGSGWVTGAPTPGAQNTVIPTEAKEASNVVDEEAEPAESNGGGRSVDTQKTETVTLSLPDPELTLSVELPSIAYVNQPITFSVLPEGISDRLLASVDMVWNFGDAHTATGRDVEHAYAYPGKYAVSIHGSFATHEELARHTITVLPVTVTLTRTPEGDVQLHNTARYELDLSEYVLRGRTSFTFPKHTFLLPQATLTVPRSLVGSVDSPVLYDQKGMMVAYRETTHEEAEPSGSVLGIQSIPSVSKETEATEDANADFTFVSEVENAVNKQPIERAISDLSPIDESSDTAKVWPYLGLMGIVMIGMTGLVFGRRNVRSNGTEEMY